MWRCASELCWGRWEHSSTLGGICGSSIAAPEKHSADFVCIVCVCKPVCMHAGMNVCMHLLTTYLLILRKCFRTCWCRTPQRFVPPHGRMLPPPVGRPRTFAFAGVLTLAHRSDSVRPAPRPYVCMCVSSLLVGILAYMHFRIPGVTAASPRGRAPRRPTSSCPTACPSRARQRVSGAASACRTPSVARVSWTSSRTQRGPAS